jgi:hypothetical protein
MRPIVGRGLATADFDNDGDLDMAINIRGDYPELLRNDGGNANHFLEVLLIGTKSNRDGIGATVRITSGGLPQSRLVKSGSSYLSQSEFPLTFGMGKHDRIESVIVTWPSGRTEDYKNLTPGRCYECTEGKGIISLDGF